MKKSLFLLPISLLLVSCFGQEGDLTASSTETVTSSALPSSESLPESLPESSSESSITASDIGPLYVYYGDPVTPTVKDESGADVPLDELTFTYQGDDVRYEDGKGFIALRGNTSTEVTATRVNGASTTFKVNVGNRPYRESQGDVPESEGWFDEVEVDTIASLTESFANGVDISSSKYIYEMCGQYYGAFYNEAGEEQSLFQILAEHGVNYVRLRLWNDPYNHNLLDADGNPTTYGGGACDYDRVEWMAREAKLAGMKVLLDFHYSDFWADPTNQVIPKAWANATTREEMGNIVYDYTKSTLESMKEAGCLPDAVGLGNETTRGMLLQLPGEDKSSLTGGNPGYISDSPSWADASLTGYVDYLSEGGYYLSPSFVHYVTRANEAVKDVSEDILTMVHMVRGLAAANDIVSFYNQLSEVDYDIIGLSTYAYWHWGNVSTLRSGLTTVSEAFPDKLVASAEHAYMFTGQWANNASFMVGSDQAVSSYPVSPQGQADCIHDVTKTIADLDNGWGAFYWEPAWRIRARAGWADSSSTNSWANQGLFSYDGKALGSLSVYSKMWG